MGESRPNLDGEIAKACPDCGRKLVIVLRRESPVNNEAIALLREEVERRKRALASTNEEMGRCFDRIRAEMAAIERQPSNLNPLAGLRTAIGVVDSILQERSRLAAQMLHLEHAIVVLRNATPEDASDAHA